MFYRMFSVLTLTLVLGACAIGNKYDYGSASVTIGADTDKSVSATVIDHRPYVVNGSKAPSFVGLQRGGFGNPFNVTTVSGRGLAEDLTDALVRALDVQGVTAEALMLAPGTSIDDSVKQFQGQGTDLLLVVVMREWKTDAMMRLTLHWALDASVHDPSGGTLGKHSISGKAPVGAAGFQSGNSVVSGQQASQKLTELLNHPDIVAALR
jgi:hypothetical protein